jgi:holo-[acyl-carrier protein] synthase
MVVGLGIDVTSIRRIARAMGRFGDRFAQRVLTPVERVEWSQGGYRAEFLAGRFAAKEAVVKALGGPADVSWHDIEVRRAASGAPELQLSGAAGHSAERLGVERRLVSISHDAEVAVAVVVLEANGEVTK